MKHLVPTLNGTIIQTEICMIGENWHIIIVRNDHEPTTNIRLFVITKEIQKALIGLFESILKLRKLCFSKRTYDNFVQSIVQICQDFRYFAQS